MLSDDVDGDSFHRYLLHMYKALGAIPCDLCALICIGAICIMMYVYYMTTATGTRGVKRSCGMLIRHCDHLPDVYTIQCLSAYRSWRAIVDVGVLGRSSGLQQLLKKKVVLWPTHIMTIS